MPDRAIDVFNFIVEFKSAHDGIAPSIDEVVENTEITTKSMVNRYLKKLEAAGRVRLIRNPSGYMTPRGIVVVGGSWQPPAHLQLSV